MNYKTSVSHDSGTCQSARWCTSSQQCCCWRLNLFYLHHWRWSCDLLMSCLRFVFLILSILFLTVSASFSDGRNNFHSIVDSFLDLFTLSINTILLEVDSLSQFVDIGNIVFGEKKFSEILENSLIIFVVEPEDSSFWCFTVFGYPDWHRIFIIFLESASLSHYYLLIVQIFVVTVFFILELFLIVWDDFMLFAQVFWNRQRIEYFWSSVIKICHEIYIFHSLKLTVWDNSCWIVESHPCCVWVEKICHSKFGILLEESDPDVRSCLGRWSCLNWFMQISSWRYSSSSQSSSWSCSLSIVILIQLSDTIRSRKSSSGLSFFKISISSLRFCTFPHLPIRTNNLILINKSFIRRTCKKSIW